MRVATDVTFTATIPSFGPVSVSVACARDFLISANRSLPLADASSTPDTHLTVVDPVQHSGYLCGRFKTQLSTFGALKRGVINRLLRHAGGWEYAAVHIQSYSHHSHYCWAWAYGPAQG